MKLVTRTEDCGVCGLKNGRYISYRVDLPGVTSQCDYCDYQGSATLRVVDGVLVRDEENMSLNPTPCPRCGGDAWTTSGRTEADGFICRPCAERQDQ